MGKSDHGASHESAIRTCRASTKDAPASIGLPAGATDDASQCPPSVTSVLGSGREAPPRSSLWVGVNAKRCDCGRSKAGRRPRFPARRRSLSSIAVVARLHQRGPRERSGEHAARLRAAAQIGTAASDSTTQAGTEPKPASFQHNALRRANAGPTDEPFGSIVQRPMVRSLTCVKPWSAHSQALRAVKLCRRERS